MIKNFFKKHSIHKKVVKQFDWLFAFNLPKFFILAAIFSWGMASAYFQVNSSYLSYFNTNFNYSDIVIYICLLYTSPSPRDISGSRMPSSA